MRLHLDLTINVCCGTTRELGARRGSIWSEDQAWLEHRLFYFFTYLNVSLVKLDEFTTTDKLKDMYSLTQGQV